MRISFSRGRRAAAVVAAFVAAGVPALAAPAQAAPPARTAVIVQLDPDASAAAEARLAATDGGRVRHVYRTVLSGFAGEFSDREIAALRRNPHVLSVESDGVATVATTQTAPPSWGLDRIDQRNLPLNKTYAYAPSAGSGVTAYVIDTGIDPAADLQGRLGTGQTWIADGNGTTDCNGHGTHVAGTIGGATYGVAKSVTLVPVRVLDCGGSGTWSDVIAGLDWVVTDHQSGPAVANLSLGGARNGAVDAAVQRAIGDGVSVAVAAGNSSANACNFSPAAVPDALTVGATDKSDRRASFSNFGTCVDLFAPGVSITSDWMDGRTNTVSGTSMAAPHVAGTAAVLLSQQPLLTPAQVAARLTGAATPGVVSRSGAKSPNLLLYAPETWPAP